MRYIKQTDRYSCAALAVLNALKWAGKRITKKHLPAIRKKMKCLPYQGTSSENLQNYMENIFPKCRQIKIQKIHPDKRKIDKHLENGGLVYVSYCTGNSHKGYRIDDDEVLAHCCLMLEKSDDCYKISNYVEEETVSVVPKKEFVREVWKKSSKADNKDGRMIWLLSKAK